MSLVFQNLAGLQNRYPLNLWQELLGNCDVQLFLGCTDQLTAEFVSSRTGLASVSVTSKAKQLGTWRISNYTPEYRETSGVGKRPVLTPDEVLRLPINQALVIIRGKKILKIGKMDYSRHPEADKLTSCKASAYVPEWRLLEEEKAAKEAARASKTAAQDTRASAPDAKATKSTTKKSTANRSSKAGAQSASKPAAKKPVKKTEPSKSEDMPSSNGSAPEGIILSDKDSILSI